MVTNEHEPMSDERLAGMAARVENIRHMQDIGPRNLSDLEDWQLQAIAVAYADDVTDLLAEVERLRANENHLTTQLHLTQMRELNDADKIERLRAENAAMRPFVEAIVDYAGLKRYADLCEWCGEQGQSTDRHTAECPVTAAVAFLAQHPAQEEGA